MKYHRIAKTTNDSRQTAVKTSDKGFKSFKDLNTAALQLRRSQVRFPGPGPFSVGFSSSPSVWVGFFASTPTSFHNPQTSTWSWQLCLLISLWPQGWLGTCSGFSTAPCFILMTAEETGKVEWKISNVPCKEAISSLIVYWLSFSIHYISLTIVNFFLRT